MQVIHLSYFSTKYQLERTVSVDTLEGFVASVAMYRVSWTFHR